jgi:hypothetical protein
MILLAGGEADPNIRCLRDAAARRGTSLALALSGGSRTPRLAWALSDGRLLLDGRVIRPAAAFVRFDVFAELGGGGAQVREQAASWYYALLSWALAHPEVALPNRAFATSHAAKPYVLELARRAGLTVPETWITNDPVALDGLDADAWILKPVNGGAYTQTLRDACLDRARLTRFTAEPTILQSRLVAPDLRIFRVGPRWFAFELRSDSVDYRTRKDVGITAVAADGALTRPLGRLMDDLGLDFGAADFKRRPEAESYAFLEVNSAPMFAAFDRQVSGALSDAIIDWLSHRPAG